MPYFRLPIPRPGQVLGLVGTNGEQRTRYQPVFLPSFPSFSGVLSSPLSEAVYCGFWLRE